jgi:hypothetical protein
MPVQGCKGLFAVVAQMGKSSEEYKKEIDQDRSDSGFSVCAVREEIREPHG